MIGKKVNVSRNIALRILLYALVLVVFNFMANEFYFRLDLTKEKRYTLSPSSVGLLNKLDDDLYVTIFLDGDKVFRYPGESIHIPLGAKHRAWNETDEEVVFIEVQTGTYFGEDDIIRIEDDYARN